MVGVAVYAIRNPETCVEAVADVIEAVATWLGEQLDSKIEPAQAASLLARRPYDLRHGAASLRLNAGVPPIEVARRLGTASRCCSRCTRTASTASRMR